MNVKIIAVGKLTKSYFKILMDFYRKNLPANCNLTIVELEDEKIDHQDRESNNNIVLEKEGKRILSQIPNNSYTICLDVKGKELSEDQIYKKIKFSMKENINFVIGGSLGLSKEVKNKADLLISFSHFTLPHQLARVILISKLSDILALS